MPAAMGVAEPAPARRRAPAGPPTPHTYVLFRAGREGRIVKGNMGPLLVAVVDDDESVRESLSGFLRSEGMAVEAFASGEAFLDGGALARVACLVLDVSMPAMTGPQLFEAVLRAGSAVPVVFISARADPTLRGQLLARGAHAYLVKPFDEEQLLAIVQAAASHPSKGVAP